MVVIAILTELSKLDFAIFQTLIFVAAQVYQFLFSHLLNPRRDLRPNLSLGCYSA